MNIYFMDTEPSISVKNYQSKKILKWVIGTALLFGLLISATKILVGMFCFNDNLDQEVSKIISLVSEPATIALNSHDTTAAQKVLNGLLETNIVQRASIKLNSSSYLAMIERPVFTSRYAVLTDFFSSTKLYRKPLQGYGSDKVPAGELIISIDTTDEVGKFIQRSLVVIWIAIVSAIVLSLLIYLIFMKLQHRPLLQLIRHVSRINLENIGEEVLDVPVGHETNEIGLLVSAVNKLITSIDYHQNLLKKAEDHITLTSRSDYLTGLPNRNTIQNQLQTFIDEHSSQQKKIAILCFGLDDFKALNAQVNFNTAEHAIVEVSDRLKNFISHTVHIGRLGEDQFAIIQSQVEQPHETAHLAQTLLQQLERAIEINGEQLSLMATVGITLFPDDGSDVDTLLQQAEAAMIVAKSRRRNRYQFYVSTIDTQIRHRKRLEMSLHQAIENNELSLVFQPQFDYQKREIIGAEALLRWSHPEHGMIPPDIFIPIAEETMDIVPIGDWVLENACLQLQQWAKSGHQGLRMAINLSAMQLQDNSIYDRIASLLKKYQLKPESLELEVTETSIMEDVEASKHHLLNIKKLGVTLALDDFGTKYSSLGYLQQLPFDKVKIDKSFVDGLPHNTKNASIVDAVILICNNFDKKVVAEGVETVEQETYLIDKGCQEGQGYFYGKPMSADDFINLVSEAK